MSWTARFTPRQFAHAQKLRHARTILPLGNRRSFVTFETFTEGFLDLAIALPYPESFSPYSSTIILVAVVSRLLFTVPVSIWAKRRELRMEEIVVPQLKKAQPEIFTRVLQQMRKEQVRGTKESIKGEHAKRSTQEMLALQTELIAKHHCKPWPTVLAPLASQLPLFIGITYMLRYLSMDPTPFDAESFLSLQSLTTPDPVFALPTILGIITLANVESYKWFQTDAQRDQEQKQRALARDKRAKGEIVLPWRNILRTGMRLATPVRMVVAGIMPGSIVIYWVSSASFGLVQNWIFDWWHKRRVRQKKGK